MDRAHKIIQFIRQNPIDCAAAAYIAIVSPLVIMFLWSDSFWFADDGASYMLLAKAFSPYFQYSDTIIEGARKENYPPMFPVLLALLGASNSFWYSHVVIAGLFIAGLVAMYRLCRVYFGNKLHALLPVVFFTITPGVYLGLLGILSEPLYILLSFVILLYYERHWQQDQSVMPAAVLTLLFTALLLTRSIGISMITAFFVITLLSSRKLNFLWDKRYIMPLIFPALAALAWHYFRPVIGAGLYEPDVKRTFHDLFTNPLQAIAPQLESLNSAWHSTLHIYWTSIFSPIYIIATLIGIIAAVVLAIRLAQLKLDAWYALIYLVIITIWPYPNQQVRFLFPIFPFMLIYAVMFVRDIETRYRDNKIAARMSAIATAFFLVLVIPPLNYISSKILEAKATGDGRELLSSHYYPDREVSKNSADYSALLFRNMAAIEKTTETGATVMWFVPKYVYLLANRKSVKIPKKQDRQAFLNAVLSSRADYVYLSRLDPWHNKIGNGLQYVKHFIDFSDPVWLSYFDGNQYTQKQEFGILLKINREKLKRLRKPAKDEVSFQD